MSGNENMEEPVLVPEPQEENEEFRRMVQRIAGESFAIQDNQREVSNGSNNNNNSSDIQVVGVVSRYVPGHFVPPSVMAFLQRLGQDFRQQIEAARAEQEARNDYLVKEQVECVKYAMSLEQDAKIRGLQQQIDILFEKRQQDIREKNELTAKVEALAKVVEELKKKLDTDVEKENNTKEKEPEDNVPSLSEQVIIDQCEDQKPKNDLERPLPVHQENEPAPADDFPDEGHGFSPLIGSISSSQPEKPLTKAKTVRKKRSGNESRSKVRVVKPRNRSLEIKKKAKACRSNSNAPASTQFPCVVPNCSFIGRTLISLKRHQGVHERRRHACKDCTRSFDLHKDLLRHRISKHSELFLYQCQNEGCDKKFNRRDNWGRHMRSYCQYSVEKKKDKGRKGQKKTKKRKGGRKYMQNGRMQCLLDV